MKVLNTVGILSVAVGVLVSQVGYVSKANASLPDLKSASGTVLIAAPTALNGPGNQGIWFIDPATGNFSLKLPDLGKNYVYEGWIVDTQTGLVVSTGIFRAKGGVDSDAAGTYAGPLALNFPTVPGSDFVTLSQNIADGKHDLVITAETYPNYSLTPSENVVLKVRIPSSAIEGTILHLEPQQ